jgi:hypothetical protein
MQRAVGRMIESSIYQVTKNQKAKRGIVAGGNVIIGNKTIPYVPAVDMFFKNGDAVWCIISDSGKAVIVGV